MPKKKDTYEELLGKISKLYESSMRELSVARRNERTVTMFWQVGKFIVETEQGGYRRAGYGKGLLDQLSSDLSGKYGSGFSRSNVAYMRQFYSEYAIVHPGGQLTWSHYKTLMTVKSSEDRAALERRVLEENLSRTALQDLVRQSKASGTAAAALPSSKPTLVPREGRFDILKVIEVQEGAKTRLALDCGFRLIAKMPRRRSSKLKTGEYVLCEGTGDEVAVKRTECQPGERYCYRGYLQRVIDGDTVEALLRLPLGGETLATLGTLGTRDLRDSRDNDWMPRGPFGSTPGVGVTRAIRPVDQNSHSRTVNGRIALQTKKEPSGNFPGGLLERARSDSNA